jgi:hypothetical protein
MAAFETAIIIIPKIRIKKFRFVCPYFIKKLSIKIKEVFYAIY